MTRSASLGCLLIALVLAYGTGATAQNAAEEADASPTRAAQTARGSSKAVPKAKSGADSGRVNVLALFKQANPMLWPLVLCSIVAVGFALERLIALRRARVIPREFVTRFMERLSSGKLDRDRAAELCRANDSPVARVLGRVVHYWGQPAGMIREAVGHDAAGELIDLKRHVRVLNGTATLAPLLGLLGTVVGLIESFDALGGRTAGTGKGEALAHGISLALMTTAFGLAIAVVSVAVYYFLMNRVDVLVRDLDNHATQAIDLIAGDAGRPLAERRPMGSPNDHVRQAVRD
jgi:biopolymer transport protein ExbB